MCSKPKHENQYIIKIYCEECNRYCYNGSCKNNLKQVCDKVYRCKGCNKILKRPKKHECGYYFCTNWHEPAKEGVHRCFMQYLKQKGCKCDDECIFNTNKELTIT